MLHAETASNSVRDLLSPVFIPGGKNGIAFCAVCFFILNNSQNTHFWSITKRT
jgi:hypothetical protein